MTDVTQTEWIETVTSGDWSRIAAGFKTNSPQPVSHAYFEETILVIAKAYRSAVDEIDKLKAEQASTRREHRAENAALRKELEGVMRWRGIWRQDKTFHPGETVTHNGSLFMAQDAVDTRPGVGDGNWRLVVKNGAFADKSKGRSE